ncbi:MAG: 16S rRNA (cytidine(1402)-2'-O)-methyltransferase [Desulfobacteraceae bacterium]|nr:16S rRNA (cytidine(1402)-2'-O)-methyltransferase [Desulfobacteraceae bacterium]
MHSRQNETGDPSPGAPGTLYVVATPIGNLEDITFRAVRILKEVQVIAAEDTRHTGKLLSHYQIKNSLVSCHEHNEEGRIPELILRLSRGDDIALVSDAGTPSVSDPGYRLIRACAEQGIRVVPVPGPSAAVAGLSVSGLPTDSFLFLGFLPRKSGKRRNYLESLKNERATLVIYESPRRILGLLSEIVEAMGDRPGMLAREITKIHEEYLRGNLSEIIASLEARASVKGECALFVSGAGEVSQPMLSEEGLDREILAALAGEGQRKKTSALAKELSKRLKLSKKTVYDRILVLQDRK